MFHFSVLVYILRQILNLGVDRRTRILRARILYECDICYCTLLYVNELHNCPGSDSDEEFE